MRSSAGGLRATLLAWRSLRQPPQHTPRCALADDERSAARLARARVPMQITHAAPLAQWERRERVGLPASGTAQYGYFPSGISLSPEAIACNRGFPCKGRRKQSSQGKWTAQPHSRGRAPPQSVVKNYRAGLIIHSQVSSASTHCRHRLSAPRRRSRAPPLPFRAAARRLAVRRPDGPAARRVYMPYRPRIGRATSPRTPNGPPRRKDTKWARRDGVGEWSNLGVPGSGSGEGYLQCLNG